MGYYSKKTIKTVILNLRDAITLTSNASLAICWIVELFVAMCAYKHGITTTLYYLTSDARKHIHDSRDYAIFKQLVRYRNKYVHEGYLSINSKMLNLDAVRDFALKYCSISVDFDSKKFDEF